MTTAPSGDATHSYTHHNHNLRSAAHHPLPPPATVLLGSPNPPSDPSQPPLAYTSRPLQIDASKFDRVEIANAVYSPILGERMGGAGSTTKKSLPIRLFSTLRGISKFEAIVITAIALLLFRATIGLVLGSGDDEINSLNSSIQLGLYACIWALCYYITQLYSPYFAEMYLRYINAAQSRLDRGPNDGNSSRAQHQPSLSHLSTQFIINTDRKLTLYIFFIFNLLLFTLLVGLIEDFHGNHTAGSNQSSGVVPITSLYDSRHALHTFIPGHLDPPNVAHIVNPHKALQSFLQLYPFHNAIQNADSIGAARSSLYVPVTDPVAIVGNISKKDHDDHEHHLDNNTTENKGDSTLTNNNTHDHSDTNDQTTTASPEDRNAHLASILQSLEASSSPLSSFPSLSLTTILLSLLLHTIILILTYPYSSHLITSIPILTFYATKKPTGLIEKWYCGLHGISKLVHDRSGDAVTTLDQRTNGKRSLRTMVCGGQNDGIAPKWSYKWFYHTIYPTIFPPTLLQSLILKVINVLDIIGIGINPISLYDVTIASMCWYVALFIVMKDSITILSFFSSNYLYPLYSYYQSHALSLTSHTSTPSFAEIMQIVPIIFMVLFSILWLLKIALFVFTLYWTIVVTWSLVLTLLRSSVTSTSGGSNRGGNAPSSIDGENLKQVGLVLKELEAIYKQQYHVLESEHWKHSNQNTDENNPNIKNLHSTVFSPAHQLKLKQLRRYVSILLFERLHVWRLSHNISIVTLCIYYNNVLNNNIADHNQSTDTNSRNQITAIVPQWCIDIMRCIIHDNSSLGSGQSNNTNNINNGKLSFAMLLQLPAPQTFPQPTTSQSLVQPLARHE